MPGQLKQNLIIGERVVMSNTTDPELDDKHGVILGKTYSDARCDFYIVGLDTALTRGDLAIQLIESCIDPI